LQMKEMHICHKLFFHINPTVLSIKPRKRSLPQPFMVLSMPNNSWLLFVWQIPVIHHLPGVGQNYQDHPAHTLYTIVENTNVAEAPDMEEAAHPLTLLKWLVTGKGGCQDHLNTTHNLRYFVLATVLCLFVCNRRIASVGSWKCTWIFRCKRRSSRLR